MTYQVNAWLERPDPRLQVIDRRSGERVIDWGAERVRALIERGELCVEDFWCQGPELQARVRELFLQQAVEAQGRQR